MTNANTIYNAAASAGKAQSNITAVIGTIIGIIMIGISIYLFTQNQNNLVDSTALVTSSSCLPVITKNESHYNCSLGIKYQIGSEQYTGKIVTNDSTQYNINNIVGITYDSNDPKNVTNHQVRSKTIGIVLCSIGIIIVVFVWINFYYVHKYKSYAAQTGTDAILSRF
ncbi:hypothetical protein BMW23_0204 [Bodo saltans virus]|uniref:Transmembrane protein n=1 Tax=Bodo saltans virus TaxID=2024608 RepID=A0A2H4UTK0_9VIRU|nr:hypothetical protein QJ851_gp0199 [Bodo saltans virus]ATZ80262.1 hypothetical protein BMW23_0204 [Bodo saltans virus]